MAGSVGRTRSRLPRQRSRSYAAYHLDRTMSYRRYATTHHRHRWWPDVVVETIPLPAALSVAVCAILFFAVGAAVALPFGFLGHYVRAPAMYLGSAGFALVLGAIHWASLRFHQTFEDLRPIFTVNDDIYLGIITKWLDRSTSKRLVLLASLGVYLAAGVAILGPLFLPAGTLFGRVLRPEQFSPVWYFPENRAPVIAILLVLGAAAGAALGTGIQLLLLNIGFVLELRKLPVVPMPNLVRARLRGMVDLYVGTSLAWTAGVALVGVLFYRSYDPVSLAVIVVLFTVGILTFGVPQLVCRQFITRSYDLLCAVGLAWFYRRLGVELRERAPAELRAIPFVGDHLTDLSQLTARPRIWVYDSQDVFLWLSSQTIAILAVFAHGPLGRLISQLA